MQKKTKKFTLLELLIVVAVIMILISLLLPSLAKAKDMSKRSACSGNMRQLGLGFTMYASDWNDELPPWVSGTDTANSWPFLVGNYLNYRHSGPRKDWGPSVFHCPSGIPCTATTTGAYATNFPGCSRGYLMNAQIATNYLNSRRLGSPGGSGSVMLLIELWVPAWGYSEGDVDATWSSYRLAVYGASTDYAGNRDRIAWRHNKRSNYLTKCGSVFNTGPGVTGYGEKPIWWLVTSGSSYKCWQDGYK